jgi:hypothetical protein
VALRDSLPDLQKIQSSTKGKKHFTKFAAKVGVLHSLGISPPTTFIYIDTRADVKNLSTLHAVEHNCSPQVCTSLPSVLFFYTGLVV